MIHLSSDLAGFHSHNPLRTTHWDSLEKSLTVFMLPPSSPFYSGTRRRLDLIFAPPEVYWTAVVGWYVLWLTWVLHEVDRLMTVFKEWLDHISAGSSTVR